MYRVKNISVHGFIVQGSEFTENLSSCFVNFEWFCTEVCNELSWRWIKPSFTTLMMLDVPTVPFVVSSNTCWPTSKANERKVTLNDEP
jgi:hypothetical protein